MKIIRSIPKVCPKQYKSKKIIPVSKNIKLKIQFVLKINNIIQNLYCKYLINP